MLVCNFLYCLPRVILCVSSCRSEFCKFRYCRKYSVTIKKRMYNTMSGYHTLSASVFQNNSPPGIPFLGSPESAIYRPPAPTSYQRGHTAFVSTSPIQNRGFARSGGVPSLSPQRFSTVSPSSSGSIADGAQSMDAEASADIQKAGSSSAAADEQPEQQAESLANTKEKTPMCLINELARFNKVQHQYCLTDEQGPAHKKTFFVKLKLGDEEFAASGASIKKAQHAAATVALDQTKYPHPVPKKPSGAGNDCSQAKASNTSVTPTVELNALAMKRGELAVYRAVERKPVSVSPSPYYSQPYSGRGGGAGSGFFGQRYRYPRPPHRFFVALKVGEREFIGEGETNQGARHNAASMALKVLKSLPLPTNEPARAVGNSEEGSNETDTCGGKTDSLKSEISLVHEIALKRNFTVEFEIVKESGPPHMRVFITRCTCGDLASESEGSSKKLSKKRAAEKMVEELNKLPQLPPAPPGVKPKKTLKPKQSSKNLIKNVLSNCSAGVNPISRLIQIQQAKKEKEPTFTMVEEKGLPRAREFHIQVTVGDNTCTGVGPNKRLAKRSAAEQMLQMLGYSLLAPQPSKPAIKSGAVDGRSISPSSSSSSPTRPNGGTMGGGGADKRVTFVEPDSSQTRINSAAVPASARHSPRHSSVPQNSNAVTPDLGLSAKAGRPTSAKYAPRPIDQLSYLAKIMNFELNVNNYPKDESKMEYLSVITIGTNGMPTFYNSTGPSIEAANDNAALEAMQHLSEYGLSHRDGSTGDTGQSLCP